MNGIIRRRSMWVGFLSFMTLCSGCGGGDQGRASTAEVETATTAIYSSSDVVAAFAASGIDLLATELPETTEMEAALGPAYQPDVRAAPFDLFVFRDVASATDKARGGTIEQPTRLPETTVVAHRNVLLIFPIGSGPYSLETVLEAMARLK